MADSFKVLGQTKPAATTLTDHYTVPAATQTTVSSLMVCNQGTTSTNFRVSIAIAGAVDALTQYIYYDSVIQGNDSLALSLGITLAATDKIRVYSGSGSVSFVGFGVEIA